MSLNIVKVVVPIPVHKVFDYLLPISYVGPLSKLQKGMRVKVPFGQRQILGFIVGVDNKTNVPVSRLKPITAILDDQPLLPQIIIQLLEWASTYYYHALGEMLEAALPLRLRQTKPLSLKACTPRDNLDMQGPWSHAEIHVPVLNDEQQYAVDCIKNTFNQFKVFLLEGITGSGKTEVYLRLIEEVLERDQQVLLLVPEISLTPQMVGRLRQRLGENIVLSHSKLTSKQRLDSWQTMRLGQKAVMVGTRSTIFTPFKNLGLIIIDEEHDGSFKQQGNLSYHARDVAIMRARFEQIPIVLGSATPALESIWNAKQKRYQRLTLSQRAGKAVLPTMHLLDMREQRLQAGISEKLLTLIQQHLDHKGQALLFLNRRGFAPIYLCHGCGWTVMCSDCDSPLRFHMRPQRLHCHHCMQTVAVPLVCDQCHQAQLFPLGEGTQRLEKVLMHHFPNVALIRIDADSTRPKEALSDLLARVRPEEPTILIGTQILAKGHHFPGVSLAAIIDGDAGLFGTDFRSLEHAAQLMVQVAGRAGRVNRPGQVIIQTHHPQHPLLNQLIEGGYIGFAELALKERHKSGWPPFSYLAILRAEAKHEAMALAFLEDIKTRCIQHAAVSLLGPVPSLLNKKAGYYRAQLLFQSAERSLLHRFLKMLVSQLDTLPKTTVRYSLEVDPWEVC